MAVLLKVLPLADWVLRFLLPLVLPVVVQVFQPVFEAWAVLLVFEVQAF